MNHKYESDGFLHDLGRKVRAGRLAAGQSLQELAQAAGLSARFLSELEAGRGNISVARLERIAAALEQPLPALIPSTRPDSSLRGRVSALVEGCSPEDLEELHSWLSARRHKRIPRSIALVGVRGAGKSTIGRLLARQLSIGFVEFDAALERAAGLSLVELFSIHGETYYRQLEHDVMQKFLGGSPRAVIATGGSLVTDRETWAMVRRQCHTVWLKARAKDHWDRVLAQGDVRPMHNNPAAMDELRAMLRVREPLYAQAEITVDTSRHTPEESVSLIVAALRKPSRKKRNAVVPRAPSAAA